MHGMGNKLRDIPLNINFNAARHGMAESWFLPLNGHARGSCTAAHDGHGFGVLPSTRDREYHTT